MRTSTLLAFALLLSACGSEGPAAVAENSYYEQLVNGYATVEDCRAATANNPIFNCHRSLTLCTNRAMNIIVTDIINEGRYDLDGDRVIASLATAADAPATFQLRLTADGFLSEDLGGEHPWVKRPLDDAARTSLARQCTEVEGRTWW